jgi:hypothetical protein
MERNPTKLARLMLSRENVMAKWRTPTLLEVFQCAGIERTGISIMQSNECTLYLPVWVNHTEIGMISAFLDPMLSILTKTSPVADCRLHDRHYVNDGDKIVEIVPAHNKLRRIDEKEIIHASLHMEDQTIFTLDAFHDNIITNDTEVLNS